MHARARTDACRPDEWAAGHRCNKPAQPRCLSDSTTYGTSLRRGVKDPPNALRKSAPVLYEALILGVREPTRIFMCHGHIFGIAPCLQGFEKDHPMPVFVLDIVYVAIGAAAFVATALYLEACVNL